MPLSEKQVAGRATCLATASEVPALFGLDPRVTPFMLHHIKKGTLERADIGEQEFIRWGNRLEEPIAREIAEVRGWKIRKVKRHISLSREWVGGGEPIIFQSEHPLGASLDFEIFRQGEMVAGELRGRAPFEIKAVGRFASWRWNDGPPLPVLLQLQAQLACAGASWGAVGGLRSVTGPADVAEVPRHEGTIRKILLRILEFEVELAEDRPPAPDFTIAADVEAMIALHRSLDVDKELDLRSNGAAEERAAKLLALNKQVAKLKRLGEAKGKIEKQADALWASLLPDITVAPGTLAGRVEFNEFWMKTWPLAGGTVTYEKKPSVGHGIYRRKA